MHRPELWHFAFSHFNEKVRWALDYKKIAYTSWVLSPGLHLPTALRLSGQPLTPLLRMDGKVLADSTAILLELERRYPRRALLPAEAQQRRRVLALEQRFGHDFGDDIRSLFYSCYLPNWRDFAAMSAVGCGAGTRQRQMLMYPLLRPLLHFKMRQSASNLANARKRLRRGLDGLLDELAGREYLVGGALSLADLTAASLLYVLAAPSQFPYLLPQPSPPALLALQDCF